MQCHFVVLQVLDLETQGISVGSNESVSAQIKTHSKSLGSNENTVKDLLVPELFKSVFISAETDSLMPVLVGVDCNSAELGQ